MIVTIVHNAVNAKLHQPTKQVALYVSELLSYVVDGYEHMTKRAGWDGRSSFYSFKNHSFPAGFVNRVRKKLTQQGHKVKVVCKPLPPCEGDENPVVDNFGFDSKYSYQMETVRKLEKFGMIVAMLATGGGKTRVAKLAYARVNKKTLFLTTRSSLMYQFYDSAVESFGADKVGIVGDSTWDSDKQLVCGMVQTLAQRIQNPTAEQLVERLLLNQTEKFEKERDNLKQHHAKNKTPTGQRIREMKTLTTSQIASELTNQQIVNKVDAKLKKLAENRSQTLNLLNQFEFIIAEEAHESGSNSYFDVMQTCKNARYRLALTATPFMKADAESNMRLMGCSGGIGIKVTERQLIDKGILATPVFKIVRTEKPPKLARSTPYARAYDTGIVNHEWRNKYIVSECVRMAKYNLTVMILVQRVKHGNILKSWLDKVGLKAKFIKGDNNSEQRKKALSDLGGGKINVLIGTNILDVGVDVPSVGCVILAGGGKAEVANRQRIGRGLRAKKEGPNVCFVLDFMDEHNNYLQKHAIQRREIISGTDGFRQNLLPIGTDWTLTDYGFSKEK